MEEKYDLNKNIPKERIINGIKYIITESFGAQDIRNIISNIVSDKIVKDANSDDNNIAKNNEERA